ncbi:hypothetical protein BD310DRAFT_915715 [Dichomitus squalens]|uniref:RNase P subunit Pop3-domain-containing protein n=1 Tax=Dichomitus squalens TaxID=114155 RepID=A0A4Q9Q9E5_9APHY|nr:hypothetical protein BD310DRAFT_915715 [Dichomitus squalens]
MSQQIARAHTSQSNRAKPREGSDRRVQFRSVVDNPFHVQWPSVPANVQNAILACMLDMLSGLADHNLAREQLSRKRRRCGSRNAHPPKRAKVDHSATSPDPSDPIGPPVTHAMDAGTVDAETTPSILSSLTIGINGVTKRLEGLVRSYRRPVESRLEEGKSSVPDPPTSVFPTRLVIACRSDSDPPMLMGHIPNLVGACNSARKVNGTESGRSGGTWLVPMPKGTEDTLSAAMGLRRVSILLVDSSAPNFCTLASLLENVPLPVAPWLSVPNTGSPVMLIPTHIKQLRTSAPKDMKAAKEKRSKERAAAKERRRCALPKRIVVSSSG